MATPAAPALSSAEYNASNDAAEALVAQLSEAAAVVQDDVDESPDLVGLQEKEGDKVIDRTDKNDPLYAKTVTSFEDERLDLPPELKKALFEMKFVRPSKIQAASLPKIWAGRNLLAQSHNGTGKTACFVLGMLKVVSDKKVPQALCICPTRELAAQIGSDVLKMGKYMVIDKGLRVKVIMREERYEKGATMEEQVIVGTPGKVWTLINMRVMGTDAMRVFVLDEADEMLALGGLGDTSKRIRQKMPKGVQTLFFSATWTEPVVKFAKQLSAVSGHDWSQIEVQRDHIFNDQVRQMFYRTSGVKEKEKMMAEILFQATVGQCIIFVHTREAVEKLGALLKQEGHQVSMLHGKMDGPARDKVLFDFREGTTRFLITTNVLSRGIDVPAVTLVIQYDMPVKKGGQYDPDTYLHRVGRTGRFGRPGCALNMIHDDAEMKVLRQIETYYTREGATIEVPKDTSPEKFAELLTAS